MTVRIIQGDCRDALKTLPDESVHCVATSPPYWGQRDYGHADQLGLEASPQEYVERMVEVFREVRRVLRSDGTLWLNLGDSFAQSGRGGNPADSDHRKQATNAGSIGVRSGKAPVGLKPKDICGIPWRVAFALQAAGWWLRQDIIWHKPNPMPESVTDRCTKSHEYLFLLAKSERYFFDAEAISEPATGWNGSKEKKSGERRNKRSVWTVATKPCKEAHFATFPPALIEPCIIAGCPIGGTVLDPFGGAGTTGLVADRLQRDAILIELNPEYASMAERRIRGDAPLFAEVQELPG